MKNLHRNFAKAGIVFFIFIMLGCSDSDSDGSYKRADSGLEYRFIEQNNSGRKAKEGEIMQMKFKYATMKDSVLYDGPFQLQMTKPAHKGGSIEDAFGMMHVGDSAAFLVSADSFFIKTVRRPLDPKLKAHGDKIKFNIRLESIKTIEELKAEREEKMKEMAAEEEQLRNDYLEREQIKVEPTQSGLYFVEVEKGKGKKVKQGDKVSVHYSGFLTNGKEFDSSRKAGKPFEFVVGKRNVIAGWDEGIGMMNVGGKAKLIIPSHLGYGQRGAGRVIPPYATLVFEVEVLKIVDDK